MGRKSDKKEALKGIINRLHEGAKPEDVKEEFKEVIEDINPAEIAKIEEELIKEGMPSEKLHKLCEVHVALLKDTSDEEKPLAPPGHPINTLMEEHKILLQFAGSLKDTAAGLRGMKNFESAKKEMKQLQHIEEHFKDSEKHYVREENVLFPYLEKHGVTQPPAIMWSEHNEIRDMKKRLYEVLDAHLKMSVKEFVNKLEKIAVDIEIMLSSHFYKENNVLFPTALDVIPENEWNDIRKEFNELGYCCFTPESAKVSIEEVKTPRAGTPSMAGENIRFETGEFSVKELETLLNSLPVDITFVDKDDVVRYFSQSKDRIFPRTKAIIGRKVQQCHPSKSIHVVNKILEDFKSGKRDVAEFWINLGDKLIYIRYFAVRDKKEYLGCLEVTQDIAGIKKIEGEKRLL